MIWNVSNNSNLSRVESAEVDAGCHRAPVVLDETTTAGEAAMRRAEESAKHEVESQVLGARTRVGM